MFKPVPGRNPFGIPVGVYTNRAAGNDTSRQWSFRALAGPDKGKKVAEGDSATLIDCTPFVRTSTRERIVAAKANPGDGKGAQGHREVHAWIVGYLLPDGEVPPAPGDPRVSYNPFVRGDFYYVESGETFIGADTITAGVDRQIYVVNY